MSRTASIFFPLAISGFLMSFAQHIITAGITRLSDPEISLAAYGVALPLSVFIESPVIVLLSVANALVKDKQSYAVVSRFTIWLGLGVTAVQAVIAFTPLSDLLFRHLIGLPPEVAEATRVGFAWLIPWHLCIAWRRFLQGILINQGLTGPIGWGTTLRLVTLLTAVAIGVLFSLGSGVAIATFGLSLSVLAEAVYTTWWGRKVVPELAERSEAAPLTLGELNRFFWPLAVQALLGNCLKPVVSGALARSVAAGPSLAAWPVAYGTVGLFLAPITMLQQMAIAAPEGEQQSTLHFSMLVGGSISLCLGLFGFTPLGGSYLSGVIGLPEPALGMAVWILRLLAPLPLLITAQNWLSGTLVRVRRTTAVQQAVLADLAGVTFFIYPAVMLLGVPGSVLAPLAIGGGMALEVFMLYRALKQVSPKEVHA